MNPKFIKIISLLYKKYKRYTFKDRVAWRYNLLIKQFKIKKWRHLSSQHFIQTFYIQKNVRMYAYTDSIVSRWIYFKEYEKDVLMFIRHLLSKGDIFVDVGANIGLYTLIAASITGKFGKVYAFEPCKGTYQRLQANVSLNRFKNVICENLALSDCESREILSVSLDGHDAWNTLASPTAGSKYEHEVVKCITLDSYIARHSVNEKITLVKIDVEGWESRILKGALTLLRSPNAPVLLIEFSDVAAASAGVTCKYLYEQLKEIDYEMFIYNTKQKVLVNEQLRNTYDCVNVIAVKKNQINSFKINCKYTI